MNTKANAKKDDKGLFLMENKLVEFFIEETRKADDVLQNVVNKVIEMSQPISLNPCQSLKTSDKIDVDLLA